MARTRPSMDKTSYTFELCADRIFDYRLISQPGKLVAEIHINRTPDYQIIYLENIPPSDYLHPIKFITASVARKIISRLKSKFDLDDLTTQLIIHQTEYQLITHTYYCKQLLTGSISLGDIVWANTEYLNSVLDPLVIGLQESGIFNFMEAKDISSYKLALLNQEPLVEKLLIARVISATEFIQKPKIELETIGLARRIYHLGMKAPFHLYKFNPHTLQTIRFIDSIDNIQKDLCDLREKNTLEYANEVQLEICKNLTAFFYDAFYRLHQSSNDDQIRSYIYTLASRLDSNENQPNPIDNLRSAINAAYELRGILNTNRRFVAGRTGLSHSGHTFFNNKYVSEPTNTELVELDQLCEGLITSQFTTSPMQQKYNRLC